jgi:putative transposase
MPRTGGVSAAKYGHHILNRGNCRATVLHKPDDDETFVGLLTEAKLPYLMRVLAYCLMFNHFHLALWPVGDGDLRRWTHWLLTAHVQRHPIKSGFRCKPVDEARSPWITQVRH